MDQANEAGPMAFNLQRLRMERIIRNYPVLALSEALGISKNAYYKKERGDTNITVNELCVIMNALRIPPQDLHHLFTPSDQFNYQE